MANIFSKTSSNKTSNIFSSKSSSKKQEKDQPLWLDVLDFFARPQRAITGGLANITDKDPNTTLLGGVWGGLSGKEKKDTDKVLENLGWKQKERGTGYSILGTKGALDLFDVTALAGDILLDPTNVLTFGGRGAAVKAGSTAAFKVAKKIAAKNGINLSSSITAKGQRKAIDDMLDTLSKKGSYVVNKNNDEIYKTKTSIEGITKRNNKLEDMLKKETDESIIKRLNKELSSNKKTLLKKQNILDNLVKSDKNIVKSKINVDVYRRMIENEARKARVKQQNSLINIDIPFTTIVKSLAKKPNFLKIRDAGLNSKELSAASKILDQLFVRTEDIERLEVLKKSRSKDRDILIKNTLEQIAKRKSSYLNKVYNVNKIEDLTLQQFKDMEQRLRTARQKQLPDAGVVRTMIDKETGKPVFETAREQQGYQSKFLRDFSVKGVPKNTRKLLDELDYYLKIIETNKFPRTPATKGLMQFQFEKIGDLFKNAKYSKKKKAEINQNIKKMINDAKSKINFDKLDIKVTPKTKTTLTNIDTKKFVLDMGGKSLLGEKLSRLNPFNARTLNSLEEGVNDIGDLIRSLETRVLGQNREMERVIMEIKKLAKGLTPEQVRAIPYIVQKSFPDKVIDEKVAKEVVDLEVQKIDLKEQYDAIKKSKSATNTKLKEDLTNQIGDLDKQIKKLKSELKLNYKDSVLKIAKGNEQTAKSLEVIAQKFRNIGKMIKESEVKAGSLDNVRADYFAHVLKYTDQQVEELKKVYRNDPDIGVLISKSAGNRFAKERKSFQTLAEVDNKIAVLQERINTLPSGSEQVQKLYEKLNVISNLYERDPFTAMAKRYYKSIKTVAWKELQTTLRRRGYILEKNETTKGLSSGENDYFKALNKDEAKALGLPEGTQIHREVLEGMEKVKGVFTNKGMENVLRHAEAATNAFKTVTTTLVPSHYWFNFVGSVANNALAGVSLSSYSDAIDFMVARNQGKLTAEQEKIYTDMLENGVINQTSFADLLGTSTYALEKNDFISRMEKRVVDNPATRFVREKIGDPMDNYFRIAHYIDVYKKTGSTKLASESVRKYLFNYAEVTSADRFMKVIMPFWNWTKNNIPLQIHKLATTPRFGMLYMRIKEQSQGDVANDPTIPNWLKNDYIRFGENAFYNLRLPTQDLQTVTDMKKMLGLQTPFTKIPFELSLNKSLFTGKPIDYEYDKTGDYDNQKLLEYWLGQTGLTSRGLSAYEGFTNTEDEKKWYDNVRDILMGKTVGLKKE